MAEEEEYTVEKILDKRTRGGKTEYLIKWEGYPDRYTTVFLDFVVFGSTTFSPLSA